jgi:hypothetical protein
MITKRSYISFFFAVPFLKALNVVEKYFLKCDLEVRK